MRRPADPMERLRAHLPDAAWPPVQEWLRMHPVKVHVVRPRTTKLGDYRNDGAGASPRITVNADLNPYAFLVTLIHEFAHHAVHLEHRRAQPHGAEWRVAYRRLMRPYLSPEVLPPDVLAALQLHLLRTPASSCADPRLMRALHRHDEAPGLLLERLPEGAVFDHRNRLYVKGPKRRTRFVCRCLTDGRTYLMPALVEVRLEKAELLAWPVADPCTLRQQ